jgi:hypothetical protein
MICNVFNVKNLILFKEKISQKPNPIKPKKYIVLVFGLFQSKDHPIAVLAQWV